MNRAEFSEGEGMSEWKEYQLNEVYNFASGLSKSREEFGFGFPFLSFKEVFHNYFLPKNLESLVNTTEIERQRCSVKRGDVFLTRTSETQEELGMSSVALIDYPDTAFNGFTKRLRPNGLVEAHPEYVGLAEKVIEPLGQKIENQYP
jgi:type I restriction enzyme, S subunit